VRFSGRAFPALGVVVAATAVLSACSGDEGDGRDRSDAPKAWSVCNELFGSSRIDALQAEMGDGTLGPLNSTVTVDELMSDRASVARSWEPGSEAHYSNTSHPCDLGVDGTGKRFNSYVSWSVDSPQDIKSGDDSGGEWQSLGNDIYVKREDADLHLTAVIPCKIKGSHTDQEAELPLEVETEVKNVPDFDTKLLSEMTAQLASKLVDGLPCTNDPEVPGAF
jgi:hypothetical protein